NWRATLASSCAAVAVEVVALVRVAAAVVVEVVVAVVVGVVVNVAVVNPVVSAGAESHTAVAAIDAVVVHVDVELALPVAVAADSLPQAQITPLKGQLLHCSLNSDAHYSSNIRKNTKKNPGVPSYVSINPPLS
ncbi:unnamed protein product, partial [Allacma fusca]